MSESIGATLKAAREKRRLTLAEVSDITKVRTHYLQALENDDLSAMPSAAQGRGFLRIYTEFLGLDLKSMIPPAAPTPEPEPNTSAAEASAAKPQSKGTGPGVLGRLRERISSLRKPAEEPGDAESTAEEEPAKPPEASAGTAAALPEPDDKKKARR